MQASSSRGSSERPQKHVRTACLPCRKLKKKCDGELPCSLCTAKGRQCEYPQEQDGRLGKRPYQELNTKSEMFDTIIKSLKNNDSKSNEEFLNIIRSGATPAEMAQHAAEITRRTNNPLKRTQGTMTIDSLVDQPLFSLPAQPWTDVTKDDAAVSHLFSIYLTWQHSAYPVFASEILIPEIQSQRLQSHLCSPFLVNALLTVACMYTDHPVVFSDPSDMSTRGTHFFKEAVKLWEREEGNPTLTNLQALTTLIVSIVYRGKDRMALLYISQLHTLRQSLYNRIRRARKLDPSNEYNTTEFQRSWRFAAWASFKLEVEMSMSLRTPLNLVRPIAPRPWPKQDLDSAHSEWRPYPRNEPETTFKSRMNDDAGCTLYEIGADICSILLSGDPQDSPLPGHTVLEPAIRVAEAHRIEHDLLVWQDEQPPIPITTQSSTNTPLAGPIMDAQLTYNIWRIEVNSIIFHEATIEQADRDLASDKILSACERIANLLEYGHNTWGLSRYVCHAGHAASMSANHLINYLQQPHIAEIFHTMIITLTSISYRWTLVRGIIRTLWFTIVERKLENFLLETTMRLLKLNAIDTWGREDHHLFVACDYPNYAASSNNGRELNAIGDLLASYAQLDINKDDRQPN